MSQEQPDRVMVDIETLGLESGSVILSVGAVRFDAEGLGDEFYRSISRESCESVGLDVDQDTLEWWRDQGEEARHVLQGGEELSDVLEAFASWFGTADEIWANSPSFDCEQLEAAYAAAGLVEPWEFYQERDHRTVASLPVAPDLEHDGVEHDALDDAKHQARIVSEALQQLVDSAGKTGAFDDVLGDPDAE